MMMDCLQAETTYPLDSPAQLPSLMLIPHKSHPHVPRGARRRIECFSSDCRKPRSLLEKLLQSWFLTPRPYGYYGNALMMLLIFPFFLQLLSSYHILSHSATTCKPLPGMFECVDNQVKGRSKPSVGGCTSSIFRTTPSRTCRARCIFSE